MLGVGGGGGGSGSLWLAFGGTVLATVSGWISLCRWVINVSLLGGNGGGCGDGRRWYSVTKALDKVSRPSLLSVY